MPVHLIYLFLKETGVVPEVLKGVATMITEFGKYLRKLRIDHGEVLMDMAKHFGVTASFLSAVEVGKKNVPVSWPSQIVRIYGLTSSEEKYLTQLAEEAATTVKLNMRNLSVANRKAALVFARNFDTLTDDESATLIDYFNSRNKGE